MTLADDPTEVKPHPTDASNGYDAVAREFIESRVRSAVGVATVRAWARDLQSGAPILDLGCGSGAPIAQALVDDGFRVAGVDASPAMIAAFHARFPGADAECAAAEQSRFFGRPFDGVVAWGLLFLLSPDAQATVIGRVARALAPGGRLLFTAPRLACEWPDNLTGRRSVSLGAEAYRRLLSAAGLTPAGETDDEGDNHYYFAVRDASR